MFLLSRSGDSGLQRLTACTRRALGQMEQKLPDPQSLADTCHPSQAPLTQVPPVSHSHSYPCTPLSSARAALEDLNYVGRVGTSPILSTSKLGPLQAPGLNQLLPFPTDLSKVKPLDFMALPQNKASPSEAQKGHF